MVEMTRGGQVPAGLHGTIYEKFTGTTKCAERGKQQTYNNALQHSTKFFESMTLILFQQSSLHKDGYANAIAAIQVAPLIHRTRHASSQVHSQVSKPWVVCNPTAFEHDLHRCDPESSH